MRRFGIEGKNEGALAAERVRAPERGDALPPTPAELHFLSSMPVFSAGGITGSLVLACVCGGKNVRVRACPFPRAGVHLSRRLRAWLCLADDRRGDGADNCCRRCCGFSADDS
jgi:hypothetical protein